MRRRVADRGGLGRARGQRVRPPGAACLLVCLVLGLMPVGPAAGAYHTGEGCSLVVSDRPQRIAAGDVPFAWSFGLDCDARPSDGLAVQVGARSSADGGEVDLMPWDGAAWEKEGASVGLDRLHAVQESGDGSVFVIGALPPKPDDPAWSTSTGAGADTSTSQVTVSTRLVDGASGATVDEVAFQVEARTWYGYVGAWTNVTHGGLVRSEDAATMALGGVAADGLPLPLGFAWLPRFADDVTSAPAGPTAARDVAIGPGDVLLVAVAPDLEGNHESVSLASHLSLDDLHGLRVSDGEGHIVLVSEQPADGGDAGGDGAAAAATAAGDGAWFGWHTEPSRDGWSAPPVEQVDADLSWASSGQFALRNAGDGVAVWYGDRVLDGFLFGDVDSDDAAFRRAPGMPFSPVDPRNDDQDSAAAPGGDAATTGAPVWDGEAADRSRIDGRVYVRAIDAPPHGSASFAYADRYGVELPTHPYVRAAGGATSAASRWIDTDTAADWSRPRIVREAQHDAETGWRAVEGEVRGFVCPDRCHAEVMVRVEQAESEVFVWMYDLSLYAFADALAEASRRGVDVRVFTQDAPVAASSTKRADIAANIEIMQAAGVDVRVHERARFDHMHAKAMVVDGAWTLVLSENANPHGWPADGRDGNRGWGIAIHDVPLASWFRGVFELDHAGPDTRAADPDTISDTRPAARYHDARPLQPARHPTYVVRIVDSGGEASSGSTAADDAAPVHVLPLLAPDHTGEPLRHPVVAAIDRATAEVAFQQLALPLRWTRGGYGDASPFVAAMGRALDRDVSVVGMSAGAFLDDDPETSGNDDLVAMLQGEHANASWRFALGTDAVAGIVHNKGWLVDADGQGPGDDVVVVGSTNGNLASQAMNREIAVMVRSAGLATFYRDVLLSDLESGSEVYGGLVEAPRAPDGGGAGGEATGGDAGAPVAEAGSAPWFSPLVSGLLVVGVGRALRTRR